MSFAPGSVSVDVPRRSLEQPGELAGIHQRRRAAVQGRNGSHTNRPQGRRAHFQAAAP